MNTHSTDSLALPTTLAVLLLTALGAGQQSFDPGLRRSRLEAAVEGRFVDIDGDGDFDLFPTARNDSGYLISEFGWPGRGRYVRERLADIDGDSDLDCLSFDDGPLQVFVNQGGGTFVNAPGRVPTTRIGELAPGDFDRDGDVDVLVRALSQPQNQMWLNDGTGVFTAAPSWPLPTARIEGRALSIDIDRDGDVDVFGMQSLRDVLYRNNGAGGFVFEPIATPAFLPELNRDDVVKVALDASGRGLLAVARAGVLYAHRISPGGIISAATTLVAALNRSFDVGDLDGDGDIDLLLRDARFPGEAFRVLLDEPGGFVDRTSSWVTAELADDLVLGSAEPAVILHDFDGDGDLDVALSGPNFGSLLLNDGGARFHLPYPTRFPPGIAARTESVVADLDGDGDVDVLNPSVLLRNRDGFWHLDPSVRPPEPWVRSATADLDGDGDVDLATADGGRQSMPVVSRLHWNNGRGTFSSAGMPASSAGARDVVAADFDGDGDVDLFFACWDRQNALFLNDGRGAFRDATAQIPVDPHDRSVSAAAGDVDVDGDLDIVVGNEGHDDKLYLNRGDATFSDATFTHMPSSNGSAFDVAIADVTGDGEQDILVHDTGIVRILVNDGTAHFRSAQLTIPLPGNAASQMFVADLDADGDRDVVVFGVFINDGRGVFAPLPERALFDAVVDIDSDGDLDLLAPYSRSGVLVNIRRQLLAPEPLRAGIAFELVFRSTFGANPHTAAIPLLGARLAPPVVLPPFGMLQVDPAAVAVLPAVVLAAAGEARISLPVPSTLFGEFTVQAAFIGGALQDWRLSNVITERPVR